MSSFDLGSNMTQWYGQSLGGKGYPQNAGILVVLVVILFLTGLAFFKVIYYIDKYCSKRILVPCTLFRLVPYAVECILKCVILLCYIMGLFCLWFWEVYHPILLFLTPLLFGTPEYAYSLRPVRWYSTRRNAKQVSFLKTGGHPICRHNTSSRISKIHENDRAII